MSNPLDAALTFLVSSYAKPVTVASSAAPSKPKEPKVKATKEPKAKKGDKAAAPKPITEIDGRPLPVTPAKPEVEHAAAFLASLRTCGLRPNDKGILTIDQTKVKPDEIHSLVAFVGYDFKQPHGSQLDTARRQAAFMVKPQGVGEFHRGSKPSLDGYVAGMPDAERTVVQDLLGRERLAAEALSNHMRVIKDPNASDEARTLARGMMAVERARLNEIQKDLRSHG